MSRPRPFRPRLELLEGRCLLSGAAPPLRPVTTEQYERLPDETRYVPARTALSDGAPSVDLFVRLMLPSKVLGADGVRDTADDERVPVILFYTPYGDVGNSDPSIDLFVRRGYAVAVAHMPGTGNSGGAFDGFGPGWQAAGYDVVEWLGTRPWSNGRVGMSGASAPGVAANMVAAARPPHLATIVPVNAAASIYDVGYRDGLRYAELDPAQFSGQGPTTIVPAFSAVGLVPPLNPQDAPDVYPARAAERGGADMADIFLHVYDQDPVFDAFWKARDWVKDAARLAEPAPGTGLEVSALIIGSWREALFKASLQTDWFRAIPADDPATAADEGVPFKMLVMDKQPHGASGSAPAVWADRVRTLTHAWFDHFLYGHDTNVTRQAPVWSIGNDAYSINDSGLAEGDKSVFHEEWGWPVPGTASVPLFLHGADNGVGGLSPRPPRGGVTVGAYFDSGAVTEGGVLDWREAATRLESPGLRSTDFLWFESAPLKGDLRIAGEPLLKLLASTSMTSTHFTPVLFDLGPIDDIYDRTFNPSQYAPPTVPEPDPAADPAVTEDGVYLLKRTAATISRGFLNARYTDGLEQGVGLVPGQEYAAAVRFIADDWTVRAGHRLGLAVMSSNAWWAMPDQQRAGNTILSRPGARAALYLPVVGGEAALEAALGGRTAEGDDADLIAELLGELGSAPAPASAGSYALLAGAWQATVQLATAAPPAEASMTVTISPDAPRTEAEAGIFTVDPVSSSALPPTGAAPGESAPSGDGGILLDGWLTFAAT